MHVVYKITLGDRIKTQTPPYFYIGSKSNCRFDGEFIYDRRNRKYYGSSKSSLYKECLERETSIKVEILHIFDTYDDCLEMERKIQIENDVVVSNEYFNCSIATINNLTNPDYITAKQLSTGKTARIHKNKINNDWVGVSRGKHWFNNGVENGCFMEGEQPNGWVRGRLGDFTKSSGNFTKNISQEELSSRMVIARKRNNSYNAWNKGKTGTYKHTDAAKEKMKASRRGRRYGEENPMFGKMIINNGIENTSIEKDQEIPDGWAKGRLCKKPTS